MTTAKNGRWTSGETVSDVYRHVLSGEKLDAINFRDEVKDIIRAYSKYFILSFCQISEKTGISTRICCALRKMTRIKRMRNVQYAEYARFGIPYAVTQLLNGKNVEYLKLHNVIPESIKAAKKCLKIIESGGKAPDLYKMGLSHPQSLRLIELYRKKYSAMSVPGCPLTKPFFLFILFLFCLLLLISCRAIFKYLKNLLLFTGFYNFI